MQGLLGGDHTFHSYIHFHFVIRQLEQWSMWMSACLPIFCDCTDSSVENLRNSLPTMHEPRTSKKYNVNDWLVAGSPANNVRNCV